MPKPAIRRAARGRPRPGASSRTRRRARTRAEQKAESREALIRAGMELFAAEGLDAPSLDAICERAGYTRGAFYGHFVDRDAFLVAVMDRVGVGFLDGVLAGADGAPDLVGAAGRFLAAVARGDYPLMRRRGGIRPHQLLDACARSRPLRTRYRALLEDAIGRLTAIVGQGQAGALVRRDTDARELARLLLAVVLGAQTMMDLDVDLDPARTGALILQLARPG
jgi:AcrR family transcriptional regulator